MSAQPPYVRVNPDGRRFVYTGTRAWSAEDYDLIEELIEDYGMTAREIRFYFDPFPTATAVEQAIRRADIDYSPGPGRISHKKLEEWREVRKAFLSPEQYARSIQVELEEAMARWMKI